MSDGNVNENESLLQANLTLLEEEISQLRRKLVDAPKRQRALEERLLETKGQLAHAVSQNEKLSYTLREAREHIASLRDEVDKLSQPPAAYLWVQRPVAGAAGPPPHCPTRLLRPPCPAASP